MPEIPQWFRQQRAAATAGNAIIGQGDIFQATQGFREIAEAGNILTQFGFEYFAKSKRAEATDQINTFMADSVAEENEFLQTLNPNTDIKEFRKTRKDMLNQRRASISELSNRAARDRLDQWYKDYEVDSQNRTFWKTEAVAKDQERANLNLNLAKASGVIQNAETQEEFQAGMDLAQKFYLQAGGMSVDSEGNIFDVEDGVFTLNKDEALLGWEKFRVGEIKDFSEKVIRNRATDMAYETGSWDKSLDWLTSPTTHKEFADEFGIGLDEISEVVGEVKRQFDIQRSFDFRQLEKVGINIEDDNEFHEWVRDEKLPLTVGQRQTITRNRTFMNNKDEVDALESGYKIDREVMQGILDGKIENLIQIDEMVGDNELAESDELYDMLARRGKPESKTDWGDYIKTEDMIMDYLIGGLTSRDMVEKELRESYRNNLADTDFMNLWNRLETDLPRSVLMNLEQTMKDNRREAEGRRISFFTKEEKAQASQANAALFEKVVRETAAGKEMTLPDIYKEGRELNIPFDDSVQFQTAPDISLDKYWDELDAESKQQLWQIYTDPKKLKAAHKILREKFGDNKFGRRPDGTQKGTGFLGTLKLGGKLADTDGVATEFSVQSDAVKVDGKRIDFPTLVPTLTQKEIDLMVNDIIPNNKQIPEAIMQKAIAHAKKRIAEGKDVFAQGGE